MEASERNYDGLLHIYECPHVLNLPDGNPDYRRCGYVTAWGPGTCPFDHGEDVTLVPLTAEVLCSDCSVPIERDDCRADDERLVCSQCVMAYIIAAEGPS